MSAGRGERDGQDLEKAILRNLLARTTNAYEEQVRALEREKELAHVTLASIADGVITTDREGRVRFLNPVASELTGWSLATAEERPLHQVFRLADELGGEIEPPVARVLAGEEYPAPEGRMMLVRSDGQRFAVEHSVAPIRSPGGEVAGAVIVFQDVTDQRLLALQLAHQATHDALTGLLNRQAFDDNLRDAIHARRRSDPPHCLLYMDLDQFKLVNDTCGHLAGDELLRRVGSLIAEEVREGDLVARLGGDEFGVLLYHCPVEPSLHIAERVHRAIRSYRFSWRERSFSIGTSVGVVPIGSDSQSVAQVLSAADHACYVAKERGRGRVQVYQADDVELARRTDEMNWVLSIHQTLEEGRFRLYRQRIRPTDEDPETGEGGSGASRANGRTELYEVLLRMVEEDREVLGAASFIRAAERYGVMREIDRWVLSRVLDHLAALPAEEVERLHTCAVNLSAVSLSDETFLAFARDRLAAPGVPADRICFEITETAAVANLAQAQRLIGELAALGCRFALDDFGSGMASYGKLKTLSIDYLKIDGAFVRDLAHNALDRAMVESINQMGQALGMRTIAEGVSSEALHERLRRIGVDYVQGFWIHRPEPLGGRETG